MVSQVDEQAGADVVAAEAAAWLARLQGPGRTPAAEAAFKEWLQADPRHARAFAAATDMWDVLPAAAKLISEQDGAQAAAPRRGRILAMAAALMLAIFGVGWLTWMQSRAAYATAPGEQRIVALPDGSRVTLNTDSAFAVSYTDNERLVRLERGEAIFEVAKSPARPFVVMANDKRVTALGTTFVVRVDTADVAVTLLEGKVEVAQPQPVDGGTMRQQVAAVLAPGERVTLRATPNVMTAVAALDRPKIDSVTAWRRGELMFDDTALDAALLELNRYGGPRVKLGDGSLAGLRVSGVFTVRNPEEFAQAVAQLHGLKTRIGGGDIVLER